MEVTKLLKVHQLLFLVLALCYPVASFSASSAVSRRHHSNHGIDYSKTKGARIAMNGISARLSFTEPMSYLRIPRGGNEETVEELASVVADDEYDVPGTAGEDDVVVQEKQQDSTNIQKVPDLKYASSSKICALISPITSILQCSGAFYSNALSAYPILTKSLTAGFTFYLSDYTAQKLENKNDEEKANKHDWTRTLTSAAVGLLYFGPAAHAWYEMIFKLLPSTSLFSTLQKAILGQVIFGPAFTSVFFATSLMQGGTFTINNWVNKIKSDLPGAWLAGVSFWPLVDFISYALVPIKFIPLFINLMSFIWTIYLSMVANKSSTKSN